MQNNKIGLPSEWQPVLAFSAQRGSVRSKFASRNALLERLSTLQQALRITMFAFVTLLFLALWSGAAHAQTGTVGIRSNREAVVQRLQTAESELGNPKLSGTKKRALTTEVATLRTRLEEGDFHVGDLFVITINRDTVSSDTASVREGLVVSIGNLPDLSVRGVLRSEIDKKVQNHVATYIKNPIVRVNVTTRITVLGAVGRPGIYTLSPDKQLTEIVMMAGGPSLLAKFDELEIKRGGKTILSAKASRKAVLEGKTLEQVGIQSGDEAFVPGKRTFNWQMIVQTAFLASSLFFALVNFMKFYYQEE